MRFNLTPNPIFNTIFRQNILNQKLLRKSTAYRDMRLDFLDSFWFKRCNINIVLKMGFGIIQKIFVFTATFCFSINAFATTNNFTEIPTITVKKNQKTGKYSIPTNFAGSATYISPKNIENRQTNDINRLARDIPGINIQEEDGYGLRPNIGIRGGRNDRSSDITLMEDGILIAPAPYAASSAYYFPSMGRVKGIEVRKGSSSIKYGPRTTSGVLNLITTPIPSVSNGNFRSSIGSFDEKNINFNYGDSAKNYGYVVNFDHSSSDGFKELDGGGDTGYKLDDFMGKFRINSDKNADIYQHLEFKVAFNEETSHETYAGLTLGDFKDNPYRRYKGTALDKMTANHQQYQVNHYIKPNNNFNLSTTAYYHEFSRNWYKLNKAGGKKLSTIFDNPTTEANALSILKGEIDGSLDIKANKRDYQSYGIQSIAHNIVNLDKSTHNFEYGLRYHRDEEDRYQHSDSYTMTSGNILLTTPGIPGNSDGDNKIASASSSSAFIEDEIVIDKLTIVPGIRFEHIETKMRDYGASNPQRSGATKNINNEDVLIPGIASSYSINDNLAVFAGVHKGFAPPSPSNNQAEAEESINYEIGGRLKDETKFLESVFFFNDYSNLLGNDTGSSGNGGTGDQYNGGEVDAFGIELATGYEFKTNLGIKFPIAATYTFNHAEFKSTFIQNGIDEWGDVNKGDKLPYIAKHQFGLSAGLETKKLDLNIATKYVDEMRSKAGQGKITKNQKIPSHFIVDFSSFYELQKDKKLFFTVDNIFNKKYVASLRPAGIRPGKPMTAKIGIIIGF